MPGVEQEPKIEAPVDNDAEFDTALDKGLDDYMKPVEETPEESSPSKETEGTETKETEDAGDDQPKKSESEESNEEVPEEDADKLDLAFRAKWNKAKEKLESDHNAKIAEMESRMLSKEDVDNFNKTTSSAAYIRTQMKAEGYTDEAIDSRLKDAGHDVTPRGVDDVALVLKELNYDPANLNDQDKAYVRDVAKIARVIVANELSQKLPSAIDPVKQSMEAITGERESNQIFDAIEKQVKAEGILDYTKDIMPEVNKWLDENEKKSGTTRDDFKTWFNDLNHRLTIERLRTGKRKESRDEIKGKQRGNVKTEVTQKQPGKMPKQTGMFDDDLDAGVNALFPE